MLEELREAGIADDSIRFVIASGTHGAHDNKALRAKLGQDILERFFVFQHNPYDNCVSVGATTLGTPLAVNREVMSCDLKIGIGCILPHPQAGFGGGGKLILPGISHIDSVDRFHRTIMDSPPSTVGMGNWDENPMRQETEDAARLVGLDMTIDALFNGRCEVTDLLVGDPVLAHHEGVKLAKEIYATELAKDADVVVTNAYAKPNEAAIALMIALRSINPSGGTIVMVVDCPSGQIVHYLLRRFGKEYGGRQYVRARRPAAAVPDDRPQPAAGPDLDGPVPRPVRGHLGEGLAAGDVAPPRVPPERRPRRRLPRRHRAVP